LELLSPDVPEWQPAIALEVLHKLIIQPNLMEWFCATYDSQPNATKLVDLMAGKLKTFVIRMLEHG
jgi:hypothetical protein